MDKKPKIDGAKPLLVISANDDGAEFHVSDPEKLVDAIYEALCASETSMATMAIMFAVERFRMLQPRKYGIYIESILRSINDIENVKRSNRDNANKN